MVQKYKAYLNLKKAKGYADGGEVTDDSQATSDDNQTDASETPAAGSSALPKTTTVVAQTLGALAGLKGDDLTNATNSVVGLLKASNPDADDATLSTQVGKNLPVLLASAFKGVNVGTNPAELEQQQADVNAQRTAAIPDLQRNLQNEPSTLYNMRFIVGPTNAQAATDSYIAQPLLGANIGQENVNATAKTQNQALVNQGQDITNQINQQTAQQGAIITKQHALDLGNKLQANDPDSPYSKAVVAGFAQILPKLGVPATAINAMQGMNAVQADGAVTALLGGGDKAAGIRARVAQAAQAQAEAGLARAQTPGAAATSAIQSQAATDYLGRPVGSGQVGPNSNPPPTGGATPGASANAAPSGGGNQGPVNSVDGLPQRRQLPAAYSQYRSPSDLQNEKSNEEIATSINNTSVPRHQAEETLDGMLTAARAMKGPLGQSPTGQQFIARFDPNRQQFHKFYEQYVAAMGGSGTNQQQSIVAGGVPSYESFSSSQNIIRDLQQLKARLLKIDYLNQGLQERGRAGDLADAQPGKTYQEMQTYEYTDPQTGVLIQHVFHPQVVNGRPNQDALELARIATLYKQGVIKHLERID